MRGMQSLAPWIARIVGNKRFAVGVIGDSQAAGKANCLLSSTGPDAAKNMSATIPTTFVATGEKSIAETRADPPTYNIIHTATGTHAYVGVGSTTFAGPDVAIAQRLHAMGIRSVTATYAIVGLALTDMIAASSFPTTPPRWYATMVTYFKSIEATYNARFGLFLLSGSNNDGLVFAQSNAIPTNLTAFRSSMRTDFPTAVLAQYKIHPDTVNFSGFNQGGCDTIANQATGFANNPDIVQVWTDDLPADGAGMSSDHSHLAGNGIWCLGDRGFYLGRRAAGWPDYRPSDSPILAGLGPVVARNGSCLPCSDGSAIVDDVQLAISCEMNGSGTVAGPTTPSGWTLVGHNSSVSAGNFTIRLAIYKRTVTSGMLTTGHGVAGGTAGAVTTIVMDTGATANFAVLGTFRGAVAGQVPTVVQAVFGTTTAGNVTTLTVPSITTGQASINGDGGNRRTVIAVFVGFPQAVNFTADSVSGMTGFTDESPASGVSSVVQCPNTAMCTFDIKSKKVPTASTISGLTATYSRTTTSPVCAVIELSN